MHGFDANDLDQFVPEALDQAGGFVVIVLYRLRHVMQKFFDDRFVNFGF